MLQFLLGLDSFYVGPPAAPGARYVGPPAAQHSANAVLAVALDDFTYELADGVKRTPVPSPASTDDWARNGKTGPDEPPAPALTQPVDISGENVLERYDPPIRQLLIIQQLMEKVRITLGRTTTAHLGSSHTLFSVVRPEAEMFSDEAREVVKVSQQGAAQQRRRTKQLAEMVAQADAAPAFISVATGLSPSTHPWTVELLDVVGSVVAMVVQPMKHEFKAFRPSTHDPRVSSLLQTPSHYAFPSGHATYAYCAAEVLAAVLGERAGAPKQHKDPHGDPAKNGPTLRQTLLRAARMISDTRVVAGVHYPIDERGGEVVGRALASWLVTAGGGSGHSAASVESLFLELQGNKLERRRTDPATTVDVGGCARWRWLVYRASQEWMR